LSYIYIKKMKNFIKQLLREGLNDSVELKSKSEKGNRYFKMLKTAEFQHYDMPKGEEDRKRLVSKLSKEDKKTYRAWLKTDEGKKSIELFKLKCTYCSDSNKVG
jgi:TnpA family transposase